MARARQRNIEGYADRRKERDAQSARRRRRNNVHRHRERRGDAGSSRRLVAPRTRTPRRRPPDERAGDLLTPQRAAAGVQQARWCSSPAGRTPALAARIASKLGVELGGMTLKTFTNGEVYCRFEESVRGCDVFIVQPTCGNADDRAERQRRADGAAGDDRRRRRRLGPPGDCGDARGTATRARTRSPLRASRSAPAWSRGCSSRPGSTGSSRWTCTQGQIQGFFQKPCDHMTALFMLTQYFADLGLEDLVVVAPDAGRVKLNKRFASQDRSRPGDPEQGAPRPAGRRDRLRDR